MCSRYYIEETIEMQAIVSDMMRSSLVRKWNELYPIKTYGEMSPTDIVPVIASNRNRQRAVFPMKWGFAGKTILMKVRPKVERIVGLTGTPSPNGLMDLFSEYKLLPGAEDRIHERISDITISMKAVQYLDMPELISTEYRVYMDDKEQEKYEQMKTELVLQLPDGEACS